MLFSEKENIFKCFGCIMKIVLENIFMCLVTFWNCYFPPPPTQNPPHTPPQQQQQKLEIKERKKKSKSHRNVDRFVGQSKAHKKSKSHRERSVRGFVARRLWVAGEVEGSWVESSGLNIGLWVRRSVKSKSKAWSRLSLLPFSLSLSLCAWVRKWFEVKILTETNFRVKAIKAHGQLKIFSGKFIFHAQPNIRIYGKTFTEVIWSQNKHSLSCFSLIRDFFTVSMLRMRAHSRVFVCRVSTLHKHSWVLRRLSW